MEVRHDLDAERHVLAACMLDPQGLDAITLTGGEFWDPRHETLWGLITDCLLYTSDAADDCSIV